MRQNICQAGLYIQKKTHEREFKQTGYGMEFYHKSVFKRRLFIHEKNMPFPSDESFHSQIELDNDNVWFNNFELSYWFLKVQISSPNPSNLSFTFRLKQIQQNDCCQLLKDGRLHHVCQDS